jgi:hypothetical protein
MVGQTLTVNTGDTAAFTFTYVATIMDGYTCPGEIFTADGTVVADGQSYSGSNVFALATGATVETAIFPQLTLATVSSPTVSIVSIDNINT